MEHWEYILLVFAVGAMHRRWLGLGNSGPRWIKLVSMALFLLVMFDPVREAYGLWQYFAAVVLSVVYWLPGHEFAGRDDLDNLAFRYMLPMLVAGGVLAFLGDPNFWYVMLAGIGSWSCWALMNTIYNYFPKLSKKMAIGRVLDGPFAYAEATSGGVVFVFLAQWAYLQ